MKQKLFSLHLLNNHYPALHGLRFIAICGVIQNHVSFRLIYNQNAFFSLTPFQVLSQNLWFVMDLFFFMSGFLIAKVLLSSPSGDLKKPVVGWLRFYTQRGFRIFPLYYFFILSYWVLIHYFPQISETYFEKNNFLNWKELFFLTNYPFTPQKNLAYWSWSLSVEEHFYILCPLIIYGLFQLPTHFLRILTIFGVWLTGAASRWWIVHNHGPLVNVHFNSLVDIYTPTHARYDIFFAGILLAYLNHFFDDQLKRFYSNKWIGRISFSFAVSIFIYMSHPLWNPVPPELDFVGTLQEKIHQAQDGILYFGTLTGIGYFLLLSWSLYSKNFLTQFLSHSLFRYFATLGYSIYLVHIPVIMVITPVVSKFFAGFNYSFELSWFVINLATLFVSTLISYALHLLIEKPVLNIRSRIFS